MTTNEKHIETLKLIYKALIITEQINDINEIKEAIDGLAQTVASVIDSATKDNET